MTAHWYMINRIGMATLCSDEADATSAAADAELMWPHNGPHRAVQLIEVGDGTAQLTAKQIIAEAEARYTLKASAQAFADGAVWAECERLGIGSKP